VSSCFYRPRNFLILILVFSLFLIPLLFRDESNPEWVNAENSGFYLPQSLIQTTDGGFILEGHYISQSFQDYDVGGRWLMKIDTNGNPLWKQTYYGFAYDATLINTMDGGFAIAGDDTLMKTDRNGIVQWWQTYTPPSSILGFTSGEISSLVQTIDGGFALAGRTRFDDDTTFETTFEMWLLKTDSGGIKQWTQFFGKNVHIFHDDINLIQTTDGGFAITSGTDFYAGGSDTDMFLVKTDADGQVEWNTTYGGPQFDTTSGLVQTMDGGFALAGATNGTFHGLCYHTDMSLVKTDSNGFLQWSSTYGTEGKARNLVQTVDGSFVFDTGGEDLMKIDATGVIQWHRSWSRGSWCTWIQTLDMGFAGTGTIELSDDGETNVFLVKTSENGIVQWNKTYEPQLILDLEVPSPLPPSPIFEVPPPSIRFPVIIVLGTLTALILAVGAYGNYIIVVNKFLRK
jgi:hypothetical protein